MKFDETCGKNDMDIHRVSVVTWVWEEDESPLVSELQTDLVMGNGDGGEE